MILTGLMILGLMGLGTAKPIRVLFLKIAYSGSNVHSSTKNGVPYFEAMLRNPAALVDTQSLVNSVLGTGASPLIPTDGFQVDTIGNGNYATPTSPSVAKLMAMLDSIDVLVIPSSDQFPGLISAENRPKLMHFFDTKGLVSLHGTNHTQCESCIGNTWASFDSVCAALLKDHVTTTAQMVRDTLPFNTQDSNWNALMSGLLPTYSFYEEFSSYTATPRRYSNVHVLYTLNENTYTPTTRMGDHPYVWYSEALPGHGGRFFYSGIGHMDTLYSQNYFFRRQFYNAVLWASRYNGPVVSIAPKTSSPSLSFKTSVEGVTLRVLPSVAGPVTMEVRTLPGREIATARGTGPQTFSLRHGTTYVVSVSGASGRQIRLVAVP